MSKNNPGRSSARRLAFLGGGIHLIPSYRALLEKLSENYTVTLFSEFYIDTKNQSSYSIKSAPESKLTNRLKIFIFLWAIIKDHILSPFDLIHCHSTFPSGICGIIVGKIFRIPVVVSLNAAEASALPEINFGDLLSKKRARINKWVINNADEVIVLTHFFLNEVRTNLQTNRSVHVIPRGIDVNKFEFSQKPLKPPVNFLNVAYLHPVKDQETLLKSYSLINSQIDSNLTFIGKDYNEGKTQEMVREMKLENKVTFSGFVPNSELPQHYARASILLHTSRFESQAAVVCEAMASGVIVCGTHVGLLADLSPECCITVKPGDAAALAGEVLQLLADPEKMMRLRKNAYEWVSKHDLTWTANKHIEIYEILLQPA